MEDSHSTPLNSEPMQPGARPLPGSRDHSASPPRAVGEVWDRSSRVCHRGEALIGWGLALLLISFAVYPSVMTWMVALWTLPAALVLLAIGAFRARGTGASSADLAAGFCLLLLGLVALGWAALSGTQLSYQFALHRQRPATPDPGLGALLRFALVGAGPLLLIAPGLRNWTDWSDGRRLGWCVVILLFPVAAFLLHQFLVKIGFLALTA